MVSALLGGKFPRQTVIIPAAPWSGVACCGVVWRGVALRDVMWRGVAAALRDSSGGRAARLSNT